MSISSAENRGESFGAKQSYSVQHQDDSCHPSHPKDLNVDGYVRKDNVQIFDQSQIILCVTAIDRALRNFEFEVSLHDPKAWAEQNSDYIDNIAHSVDLAYPTDIEAGFIKLVGCSMVYKVSIIMRSDATTDPGSTALLAFDSLYICPLEIV